MTRDILGNTNVTIVVASGQVLTAGPTWARDAKTVTLTFSLAGWKVCIPIYLCVLGLL